MKDCAPIDSLDALLSWKPDPDYLVNLSPLVNCDYLLDEAGYAHRNTPSASQVVYCHDMAGNYHETDRNLTFTTSFPAFRFFRWHLIDIFVYFSHHLITVPPISWINLAHRQGVRVYGTFILESDQCKAYREVFINPSESSRLDHSALAFRLDQLRRLGGFEGWLMNFEVSLPQDKKEATRLRIREFLSLLRKLGSDVIWYDALTWSGPLIWQNSLTVENEPFFKVADGLFLNYCWNQDKLRDSQERAGSSEASSRIFVGVDCFGRGCPGGGGFQTCKALNMILDVMVTRSDRPLSVALFAPGWAYEKSDLSSTESNPAESHALVASRDLKFWSLIAPYLHRIRGMSMGCTVLYRPAIPRLPVLQTLESAKESCQSGLLLRSTCCSGQGFFPTIGYYGSCMNWQQLIPTGRQCFESPDKNRGDNMLSQKPEFTAIQVLSSGICKPTGNCLLICPTQERRSKGSAVSFMELFSFGPHNYISNVSFLNLSISPVDLNESENTDTFKESINLHLFVDFADGPSSTTDLLCSSPKGAKTERQMLAPYSTSVGTHDSRVWISYTFSFNQLVRSEISDLIELRRIGLRWKIPAEDSGGYDQVKRGFMLGLFELRDSNWMITPNSLTR
ncbi:unnamed protein product [Calicophoron daubneyi]|uniref:Cytosolic endo-beta-N-acetylglucosaminidase TIM barrel domain-containing protein n=1 Tax=Calicophoron daubneyi TaxID=300641 RepID=A0AAV2TT42_CALDB